MRTTRRPSELERGHRRDAELRPRRLLLRRRPGRRHDPRHQRRGAATSYTSGALADGIWYFHVRAVDDAGNAGAASHYTVRCRRHRGGDGLARIEHALRRGHLVLERQPGAELELGTDAGSGVAGYSYPRPYRHRDARHGQRGRRDDDLLQRPGRRHLVLPRARRRRAGQWGSALHRTIRIDSVAPSTPRSPPRPIRSRPRGTRSRPDLRLVGDRRDVVGDRLLVSRSTRWRTPPSTP